MSTEADFRTVFRKGDAGQVVEYLQDHPLADLPPLHDLVPFVKNGTPLAFEELIGRYVERGYNINSKFNLTPRRRSRNGFTALLLSIESGNRPFVSALIKHNANVNVVDRSGYSALHWAAFIAGGEGIFADLVKAGANLNYCIDGNIPPILHIAVDEGRAEVVKLILDKGIDVNTKASYEVLSEESYGDITSRYDLNSGDIVVGKVQISTLGRAVRMRKLPILEMLLRYPKVELTHGDLNFCILIGDTMLANTLIQRMKAVSMVDKQFFRNHQIGGVHAMHWLGGYAFTNGFQVDFAEQTELLIQKYLDGGWEINSITAEGFDYDATKKRRKKPLLFMAVQHDNERLVRFLINKGSNPSITVFGSGPYLCTALAAAVERANVSILSILMESDALFNTRKNSFGKQALEDILRVSDNTWKTDPSDVNDVAKGSLMIDILLRNGIDATGLDLTRAILRNPAILKSPSTVQKLWWAGASLKSFDCVFDALDFERNKSAKDFEPLRLWYTKVASSPSLTRLAASAIRRSTKYHGIKDLNLLKYYEDLILDIPHRLS